jgi:L-alanine-DL-glutamate epimerase-like enolase superfamily enzyme
LNDPALLLDRVLRHGLNYKMMGVHLNKAMAGLDSAAWDVVAKRAGKSVCELIGAGAPLCELPVYASSLSRTIHPTALADKLQLLQSKHGVTAFKVKIGKRMGKDRDQWEGRTAGVLAAARKAIGDDALLAVDANGAYDTIEKAVEVNRVDLQPRRVWFFEEPFPWYHYDQYAQLNKTTKVAGGEQEFRKDVWEDKTTKAEKPWSISQPDMGYCGGMSNALSIARLSLKNGVDCMPHSPQGDLTPVMSWHLTCACVHTKKRHLAASAELPQGGYLELGCVDDGLAQVTLDDDGLYHCKAFSPALRVRNGHFSLAFPDEYGGDMTCKGWGITMNRDWISNAVERKFTRTDQGQEGGNEAAYLGGAVFSSSNSSSSRSRPPPRNGNPHALILAAVVAVMMVTQHLYPYLVQTGYLPNPEKPITETKVGSNFEEGEEDAWDFYSVLLGLSFILVTVLGFYPDII